MAVDQVAFKWSPGAHRAMKACIDAWNESRARKGQEPIGSNAEFARVCVLRSLYATLGPEAFKALVQDPRERAVAAEPFRSIDRAMVPDR